MEKPIITSVILPSVNPGIEMEAEAGSIYYTVDGSEPSEDSTLYTDAIEYPINSTIKAIAVNGDEKSEIAEYVCSYPLYRHMWPNLSETDILIIKKDLDTLSYNNNFNNKYIDLTYGAIRNLGNYVRINAFVLPFGFDFDDKFPNHGADYDKMTWRKGQILQKDGWLKMYDGSKWHDFQQIFSGGYSAKPAAEQGIPPGFAYFCTDRQTAEGAKNGIVIYYAGNGTWVDALGRIVE